MNAGQRATAWSETQTTAIPQSSTQSPGGDEAFLVNEHGDRDKAAEFLRNQCGGHANVK